MLSISLSLSLSMASSSSSLNWVYDVFLSFRGEDVRVTFRSHFLKELDRKLITAFKDNEIERGDSLEPELVQAIRTSRIAVVVFSKNYASSSWCLNELLEIVNCKYNIVIPVFYGLDPSHVRYQTGDFGRIFQETCKKNTKEMQNQWKKALTDVANMLGFHSATWDDEAKMIEVIADDVLGKLLLTSSKDSEDLVGIEAHIAEMSLLLQLESEEVRMVGILGSSGIGKTTIARALFNRLSRHFQSSKFIDRAFISNSKKDYSRANPVDPNMKLHLQGHFLSEILGKKDIKIDHLGALGERLKHQKVLIIIDDLDDQVVLDTLVGQTQWFGCGSRIIVVTNDKHFLRAHGIDHIYEVSLPSKECAQEMLCQSAFRKNSPPDGFEELVLDVVRHAGNLPLGLNVLGSYLRGRNKEYWMDMLPRLRNGLDGKIEKTLRVSYDGLDSEEDKAIFRHIACLFNYVEVAYLKLLLADSGLSVNIALQNLADKSLIHVGQGYVVMHRLLQEMGRKIVRTQSIDKPGEREFLVDPNDICDVLSEGIGTQKVLGISLDTSDIDELHVHESAFKRMRNLRFLEIVSKNFQKEGRLHLPESFDYLPRRLKLLCWPKYPMSYMPSNFRPENLVKLEMRNSKLNKLWEGVVSLTSLKKMDMEGSSSLKDFPDLSMATNLETLRLGKCESLVELPSSIRNLNKLLTLDMEGCKSLEILPTGFNLKSLDRLNFRYCSKLRAFPKFSTNISSLNLLKTKIEELPSNIHLENLVTLEISKEESDGKQWEGVKPSFMPFLEMMCPTLMLFSLENIPSLLELTSSFQNLNQLKLLHIIDCRNLETLPSGINFQNLDDLSFKGCSRLRSIPEISTNIKYLTLDKTGIEEVPWQIEKFSNLEQLSMNGCSKLKCVSLNISKLKHLRDVDFSDCGALTVVDLSGYRSGVEMEADNIDTVSKEASSSLPKFCLRFMDCFNLDPETVLHPQSFIFRSILIFMSGEEVPSYFTHRTTGSSSLTIPLLHVPLSQPFFRFRFGAVVTNGFNVQNISVKCEFKGRFGNRSFDVDVFDCAVSTHYMAFRERRGYDGHSMLTIVDCLIPLNEDNAPLSQRNYDHVDMQLRISGVYDSSDSTDDSSDSTDDRSDSIDDISDSINNRSDSMLKLKRWGSDSMLKLKRWGIRVLEECSVPEDNLVNKSEHSEECVETVVKRQREAKEGNMGYTPLQRLVNEIEHNEEFGENNVETERSRKRMRLYQFI